MNATTHAIFGVAALSGTALLAGAEPPIYAYPAAVAASWLPDLDNPRSRLGNGLSPMKSPALNLLTRPVSWTLRATSFTLSRVFGHRTLTHSLLGAALFTLAAWLLVGSLPGLFYALAAGYASHILADALNNPGVPLLWPLRRRFRLLPGGVRSGGIAELCVAAAVVALVFVELSLLYPWLGRLSGVVLAL